MFDGLVQEVGRRFGLGDRAAELLAALLAIVFDERQGGIAGLLAKLRQHGAGEVASTWIGNPQAAAMDRRVLDGALGPETLALLAGRLNAPVATVADASAALLPALIGRLTPGGRLPVSVPTAVAGYLVRFPSPENATSSRGRGLARGPARAALPWIRWLLLVALLLALGHCVLHHLGERLAPPQPGEPTTASPAATTPA